jgi:lipid II:glycine glycyltransferase (peptidoglycan interpeptide bridge formation enzyme)
MIEIQRCNDKQQWDDYVLEHEGHPLQLWGWGQVKSGHGWSVEHLFAYDGDLLVGATQVLIRKLPLPFKALAYMPRGPIVDERYMADFLKRIAHLVKRDHKAIALTIEPNSREIVLPLPWQKSSNSILAAETILLDLRLSEPELLGGMATDIQIKRVRTKEEVAACLDIYRQTATRAKFNLHADEYYFDVQQQLGEHSPIFAAYVNDTPIAFLWLAVSTGTAYELYGGMNEEGQQLRANYALKWHAVRKMKEWGVREYDFGGLVAGGVSIFKQGWSEPTTLSGTFDFPLSPLYGVWTKVLPKAKRISQKLRRR